MKKMSITEFANKLGVIPDTVRRWERSGKISPDRTHGGHRRYTEKDIKQALGITEEKKEARKVIYCRVSNQDRTEDLNRQAEAMELFALGRGLITETITEVGCGVNMARPKLMRLIHDIIAGDVDMVIVAHKDRIGRFGYELLESIAEKYGCELITVNSERHSPHHEVLEDLTTVVDTFAERLEGLREHKKFRHFFGDEKIMLD